MIGYIIIGLASGIISGMGIGGGTILIPALDIFFGVEQQIAQSINLIYFIPTAICAIIIHIKNKNVDKKIFWQIIFTAILGSIIGSLIAVKIKAEILKKIFGGFLFIIGIIELCGKKNKFTKKICV